MKAVLHGRIDAAAHGGGDLACVALDHDASYAEQVTFGALAPLRGNQELDSVDAAAFV